MPEELLIRHCAPTLAGLKTGNLFGYKYESKKELHAHIRALNRLLVPKGLRVIPLQARDGRALIYVYRPSKLQCDLSDDCACSLLRDKGYPCNHPDRCLMHLMQKLKGSAEFPHEIGLFLGYPPEDVCSFIENGGNGGKCVGCWKVYGDEEEAQRKFARYKKCTELYCRRWAEGKGLQKLAVRGA